MYGISASETKIIQDLVKELSEFNGYIRSGVNPFGSEIMHGSYFHAFNPVHNIDKEAYHRNIRLMLTIDEILEENCINVNSQGYIYLKDAICIIADRKSLDVCLEKEIYPYIAKKRKAKSVSGVEHSIRNAVDSAYKRCISMHPERKCIMNGLDYKATNKMFILKAVQDVSKRLLKEMYA